MDSAYYAAAVIAAIRRNGARFSVTAPVTPAIRTAIAAIPDDAWTAIAYPQAIWDDQMAAASSCTSSLLMRAPETPGVTISGIAQAARATHGNPRESASTSTRPKVSRREGSTNRSWLS